MEQCIRYNLQNHTQYVRLLELLNPRTCYIELVPLDPANDTVAAWALKHLELVDEEYMRYRFLWNENAFRHFMNLHNFFIYYVDPDGEKGDMIFETEFAWTDVTFLDSDMQPIFYTITHDGLAFINKSILDLV